MEQERQKRTTRQPGNALSNDQRAEQKQDTHAQRNKQSETEADEADS